MWKLCFSTKFPHQEITIIIIIIIIIIIVIIFIIIIIIIIIIIFIIELTHSNYTRKYYWNRDTTSSRLRFQEPFLIF